MSTSATKLQYDFFLSKNVFNPFGNTVSLAAGTSTGSVARTLITGLGTTDETPVQIRVANTSNVLAFINFGNSGVTASTTTGIPILPNTVEVFTLERAETHVAGITNTGTAQLYITTGRGA